MVLSIWNRPNLVPGYSHPAWSKRSWKAKCVERNQTQKNYFLTNTCNLYSNKNGEAANWHLEAGEPHSASMSSRAKQNIQALLNPVSRPGTCKCLTTLWLGGENKQRQTHSGMAELQQTTHLTLRCEGILPASPSWAVPRIYELLQSITWIWGPSQAL